MRNFFSSDSPFFQKISLFSELVFLNLLTLLCSLPIVTVGASATALYYTVDKLRQGESKLYRAFFHSFKENFKQATIIWLILLVAGLLVSLCVALYYNMNMPVLVGCSVLALMIWGAILSWVFPMLSKFCSSTLGTLKNAVLCGTNFLPLSIAMSLVNLVPLALFLFLPGLFIQLAPLWIFVWFSFAAYCNTGLLQKPFSTIIPLESAQ